MYMRQSIHIGFNGLCYAGKVSLSGAARRCNDDWSLRMERLQSGETKRSREWKSLGFMG